MMETSGKRIQDSYILIFGGSSGIGLGVAQAALEAGCKKLFISSSNISKLESTTSSLVEQYPLAEISHVVCDLGHSETLEQNVQHVFRTISVETAQAKPLHHIVFAAGDAVDLTPLQNKTVDAMIQSGMVRFFAAIVVAKHAQHYMESTHHNSLVFTGGVISRYSPAGWTFHAAYFAGLEGAMRNLAVELRPIRVNLVSPGPVLTTAWGNVPLDLRETLQAVSLKNATGKIATVEEVAEAYLYLMRNSNATGSIVETDGGVSAMSWT